MGPLVFRTCRIRGSGFWIEGSGLQDFSNFGFTAQVSGLKRRHEPSTRFTIDCGCGVELHLTSLVSHISGQELWSFKA